jgi:hypothetical protein
MAFGSRCRATAPFQSPKSRFSSVRPKARPTKRQLATHLDESKASFGAIAVSVGRILVPATHALMNESLLPSVQRDPQRYLRAILTERRYVGQPAEVVMMDLSMNLGKQVAALMERIRYRNFYFHERVVAMFLHAAPPFVHSGHIGRLAISMIVPVGIPGPAFTYLRDATDATYNRGWPGRPLVSPRLGERAK